MISRMSYLNHHRYLEGEGGSEGGVDDKQDELPVHQRHVGGKGKSERGVDDKKGELPVHHCHLVV